MLVKKTLFRLFLCVLHFFEYALFNFFVLSRCLGCSLCFLCLSLFIVFIIIILPLLLLPHLFIFISVILCAQRREGRYDIKCAKYKLKSALFVWLLGTNLFIQYRVGTITQRFCHGLPIQD